MKRILIVIICMLILAMPLSVLAAEEDEADEVVTGDIEDEGVTEAPEDFGAAEPEPESTVTERIVNFVTENYTESSLISFAVALILFIFSIFKNYKSLKGTMGVMNNNAVKIAEDSYKAIDASFIEVKDVAQSSVTAVRDALSEANNVIQTITDGNSETMTNMMTKAEGIITTVESFKELIETFLARIGSSEDDKALLETTLAESDKSLRDLKGAVLANANMVAELLLLANIPNSKKEELYSKHLSSLKAISEATESEVNGDDAKET